MGIFLCQHEADRWNKNDSWLMASVAEDNILQVWQMAENIYAEDGEEGAEDEDGADADLE